MGDYKMIDTTRVFLLHDAVSDDRSITLARIHAVNDDPDDEDQASAHAKELAIALVSEAQPLPRASAAAWEDGSIFVFWSLEDRRLHLFVPGSDDRQPYMYHRDGNEYGVDHGVTPARVAEWLRWYAGAELPS